MRVTKKLLTKLVNELLERVELPFTVISIERSRFRDQDYECGAWWWKANLKYMNSDDPYPVSLYSYLPFSEFEKNLNEGKRLTLYNKSIYGITVISDLEITISI